MFESTEDMWRLGTAVLRFTGYTAALVAPGAAAFLLLFPQRDTAMAERIVQLVRAAAALGLLAAALAVPLQAGYLGGGGWSGMRDSELLSMVAASPVGWAAAMAAAACVALLFTARAQGSVVSLAGAALLLASLTVGGHAAAQDPLGGRVLVLLHLAGAAFWAGSLGPLLWIARDRPGSEAAAVLERFGRVAIGAVGAVVAAGIALAIVLLGSITDLWQTPYGLVLLAKLAAVVALLGLAALNRQRLVPALAQGAPDARSGLLRSIRAEIMLVILILATTAVLTTYTTPFN